MDVLAFVGDMLKSYGPWCLGYVIAWVLWRELTQTRTKMQDNAIAHVAALTEFKGLMSNMIDLIKGMQK